MIQNCLLSLGFRHPAGGGLIHGHRQHAQKFGRDQTCSSGDILAERPTKKYTDVLITILVYQLHRFKGDECILCYTMLQVTTGAIATTFQHEFLKFGNL